MPDTFYYIIKCTPVPHIYSAGVVPSAPGSYPFWAAAVIGPIVYICAVSHAALWRQTSSIVGSIVSLSYTRSSTSGGAWVLNGVLSGIYNDTIKCKKNFALALWNLSVMNDVAKCLPLEKIGGKEPASDIC